MEVTGRIQIRAKATPKGLDDLSKEWREKYADMEMVYGYFSYLNDGELVISLEPRKGGAK